MAEPGVRFKQDDGSSFPKWKEYTISDLFSKIGAKNINGKNTNVITNSAEHGLIPQRDFFDKDIAVEGNTQNYYIIQKGDFVYNPRKSTTAPYGPFNCYMYDNEGIVSPLYTCLTPKYKEYTKYLLWYFKSSAWYSYIYHNGAQGGARHDRVGMTNELMDGIPINLPSIQEQHKVSSFLSLLDDRITKQRELVEKLKTYKRGLIRDFLSNNCSYELRTLESLFEIKAGGDIGYANYYKICGDTITVTGRGEIGHATARHENYVPIVRLLSLIPKTELDVDFFAEIINETNIFVESTGVPQLTSPQLGKVQVPWIEPSVQKNCAQIIKTIDNLVTKQQEIYNNLLLYKNGLLQQMFI